MFIVNPGSGSVADSGTGWTNSYEVAEKTAQQWLERMTEDGMTDVSLTLPGVRHKDGRWIFRFEHHVTGVPVLLETHGIDNTVAYEAERIFLPRTYWNGSSTGEPKLEDFAAPGFVPAKTFRAEEA